MKYTQALEFTSCYTVDVPLNKSPDPRLHSRSLVPSATPSWAPSTRQRPFLPLCLASPWQGGGVQPGNTFSFSLLVSPATYTRYFIPPPQLGSFE